MERVEGVDEGSRGGADVGVEEAPEGVEGESEWKGGESGRRREWRGWGTGNGGARTGPIIYHHLQLSRHKLTVFFLFLWL